jgi:serine phosphatase RsbU (regulator of sigma subunit)
VSGGRLVGVLHVGSLRPRTFTEGDVELLQIAADRVAGVTQTRLAMVEQAAAGIVQRSLLPTALPQIDGLEFAARYVAAGHGGVGGDWYDVFRLDSGDVWVVTGDVAGHGFRAAVVMARIRSAMRAFALDGNSPVDVIAKTDRKLAHFEPDDMATVACAVLRPPYDEVELAVAGHLPPVLALPGGPSVLVELDEVAPPIGAIGVLAPKATTVPFPVGAVLFFYTDGLVERRTEPLQTGLARLTAALTAGPPPAVCHAVMANLVGNYEADDDIAVIAMRRSGDG